MSELEKYKIPFQEGYNKRGKMKKKKKGKSLLSDKVNISEEEM